MTWQPFNTAPKGNSRILVSDEKDVVIAIYDCDMGDWVFENGFTLEGDGYYPTKWQPLPEA